MVHVAMVTNTTASYQRSTFLFKKRINVLLVLQLLCDGRVLLCNLSQLHPKLNDYRISQSERRSVSEGIVMSTCVRSVSHIDTCCFNWPSNSWMRAESLCGHNIDDENSNAHLRKQQGSLHL